MIIGGRNTLRTGRSGKVMKYKAAVFDLFETLITEWGHEKYTKSKMCADLGVEKDRFDIYWEEKEQDRYLGIIDFEDSILYACSQCNKDIDNATLKRVLEKRTETKSKCFEFIHPDVFELLTAIRNSGMKTAIVSNCSPEEVGVMKSSEISRYFDEIVLSCEVHMKKPDRCIYEEAAKRLGVALEECIFIGDGGSSELEGARDAGMTAVQAKWYTDQHPVKRESKAGFLVAEKPLEVMDHIRDQSGE